MRRFLEDVAIADVAFEVEAESFEELLKECGKAFLEVMVAQPNKVEKKERKKIAIEKKGKTKEEIVHEFLEELVFIKDAEQLLFSDFEIRETKETIEITCLGEKINPKKHELLAEIKAISWHMFKVEKRKKWFARVVVDV